MAIKRVRINLNLPETVDKQLDQLSDEMGLPKSNVIIVAIDQMIQQRQSIPAVSSLLDVLREQGISKD
ncbi:hypothetical protein [Lacticaseibacillus rhamnosus]|jgi:metal-responsive CopG/Arc/MetJ family transcriptional regulator|uniref:hypothetical protein n=2 Tax=Lacticaseibacillus rhamnosus TaxID=47715 RepID=UPI001E408C77|nr:hypothetical protein [Lacticaseibacillus rhamnosus]MCE3043287.1 hypothetical protein [Lacticaseibacillus rhamnosus]